MKIPVAVVGATGIAGQQVLAALEGHPYFEIAALAASERSASKSFEDAITDADSGMRRWYVDGGEPPAAALKLEVQDARSMRLDGIGVVFAAVESEAARESNRCTPGTFRPSAPRGRIEWSPTCRS